MITKEIYMPHVFPPSLVERKEIERLSPTSVRLRHYNSVGNLLEDRAATSQEILIVDDWDRDVARYQTMRDMIAEINSLPGTNPARSILRKLITIMELR